MFTGLVDHIGTITLCEKTTNGLRIGIACQFNDIALGESIAVDGICLTVVNPSFGFFFCDISPETLRITTAQTFKKNKTVNLERALCMGDRFGGHYVTGHVDDVCELISLKHDEDYIEMEFKAPTQRYFIKKGSVCLNGVSLTINELTPQGFKVMLIPHTLKLTNLAECRPGDRLNIEYDWMVKVIILQFDEKDLKNFKEVRS